MHALEVLLPRIRSASEDNLDRDATFKLVQALLDKYDRIKRHDAPTEWIVAQLVMLIEHMAPALDQDRQLKIANLALDYAKSRAAGRY